jgi:farnesyl diphosphate synthase
MDTTLSLAEALSAAASRTDTALAGLLPERSLVPRRLADAMAYGVLGPGKRLRPFLVMESARLFDVPESRALRVGAALECVHAYSLTHDDLPAMDDDDLRRGRPTLHRAFDEATAILAGDALLTLAFEIVAGDATHPDATIRLDLSRRLAEAAGGAGMVGGQVLDIEAETRVISEVSEITRIQRMKTGALFRFACEAGAILGSGESQPLRQYAEHFGLAFQISDDLLDIESTPAELGKATQKDRAKGKATFAGLLGIAGARAELSRQVDGAVAALAPFGARARLLAEAARYIATRTS